MIYWRLAVVLPRTLARDRLSVQRSVGKRRLLWRKSAKTCAEVIDLFSIRAGSLILDSANIFGHEIIERASNHNHYIAND